MSLRYWALLACVVAFPARATAQAVQDSTRPAHRDGISALVLPGTIMEDLRRTRLRGEDGAAQSLIRSTGSLTEITPIRSGPAVVSILAPAISYTYNTEIPVSANDGTQWAGRGGSARVVAGAAFAAGPVEVVLAPEFAYAQNLRTVILPPPGTNGMSAYSSPFFVDQFSADLPIRFGGDALRMVTLGQSRLEVSGGPVSAGFTTEDQWWGPGRMNALVLSNNAPGVPHLFVRTPRPLRTRVGDVEARWLLGWLTESIFFDDNDANDLRAYSAIAATLRPAIERDLTIGVARAVYTPTSSAGSALSHSFDALARWERVGSYTAATSGASEQVISLFGRWTFPGAGAEVYGEWAKSQLPKSVRELLVAPHLGQAYTIGLEVKRPVHAGIVRGLVEVTDLEQGPPAPGEAPRTFYVSRFITQGYTNRGQTLGAAIGPGSSAQHVAVDYLARAWHVGMQLGRTRWQEDAYRRVSTGFARHAHDVSLELGVRGGGTVHGITVAAELLRMHRMNYLFQNRLGGSGDDDTFDVYNTTLRLSVGYAP